MLLLRHAGVKTTDVSVLFFLDLAQLLSHTDTSETVTDVCHTGVDLWPLCALFTCVTIVPLCAYLLCVVLNVICVVYLRSFMPCLREI